MNSNLKPPTDTLRVFNLDQPPRTLQACRIRAQFGLSRSKANLIAELYYGDAR